MRKTLPILKMVQKVPAGLMIVPLALGSLFHTFFPQALEIGTPFSSIFSSEGTMTLMGLVLFFSGSQFSPSQVKITLRRGGTLVFFKLLLGVAASAAFLLAFGKDGIWGISALAVTVALTSTISAIYIGLMGSYGDSIDKASYGLLRLITIPAVPICILSFSSSEGFNYMPIVTSLLPFLLGMLFGNLDPKLAEMFRPAGTIILPFFGFCLGSAINLMSCIYAFGEGLLLTALYLLVNNIPLLFIEKKVLKQRGHASSAFCGVASSSLAFLVMIAELDPSYQPYVATASAQIASAVVFSNALAPVITRLVVMQSDRKLKRQTAAVEQVAGDCLGEE